MGTASLSTTDDSTHDVLRDKLDEGLRLLSPPVVELLSNPVADESPERVHQRLDASFEVFRVVKRLDLDGLVQRDDRFPSDGNYMIRVPSGATSFSHQLGATLLRQAIARKSSAAAIEWARGVFETRVATGKIISPVWGVATDHSIDFGNGMRLIPFADVPDGPQKRWLHRARFEDGLVHSMLHLQEFGAALVMDHTIHDVVYRNDDTREADAHVSAIQEIDVAFQDTALALTVVGPRVVTPVCRWFAYDNPDLECALGGSHRHSWTREILPLRMPAPIPLDEGVARQVVEDLFGFPEGARKTVRIAMARLQQSLIRHSRGDAAVELAVALEALLGDPHPTEMTHKVTVRGVRLLGGDVHQRKRNYALFKKAYAIRSAMVHRGEQPAGDVSVAGERMSIDTFLATVSAGCAELIRRILAQGDIPDWIEFDFMEQN